MTIDSGGGGSELSWLHCNVCHRSFTSHNQLSSSDAAGLAIKHTDLSFFFSGCAHFFCEQCFHEAADHNRCRVCGQKTTFQPIAGQLPAKLAAYLKPPIGLLEDSLSIMIFQLSNANRLIDALRKKVQHQKELLGRVRTELAYQRHLDPTKQSDSGFQHAPSFIAGNSSILKEPVESTAPPMRSRPMDSPVIRNPGRLSLKSPSVYSHSPQHRPKDLKGHVFATAAHPRPVPKRPSHQYPI